MAFEITVVRNNPLTGEEDLEQALRTFLVQIGYLPEGTREEVGFRLMNDCFLKYPEKPWTVDELLTFLSANRSTLYRYLNKLKGMDVLDEVVIPFEGATEGPSRKTRKGYRLRYSSISFAWNLVESHVQVAMQNYRRTVDHIDRLSKDRQRSDGVIVQKRPGITVDALVQRDHKGKKQLLLVKRGKEPYIGMWALPGGFIEYDESSEDAILREVEEETGLHGTKPTLRTIRSRPGRDPRGHIISLVYSVIVKGDQEPKGSDDASDARWFDVSSLPDLAFDHKDIIEEIL
jgi:8-oxo-dGTP diphosphatase